MASDVARAPRASVAVKLTAGAAVVVCLLGIAVASTGLATHVATRLGTRAVTGPHGAPSTATGQQAAARQRAWARAARQVLARRAVAIRHHDARAFLATVDPTERTGKDARAAEVFDHLAGVPVGSWWYSLDALPRSAANDGSAAARWQAPVTLHYALRGFDARPTTDQLLVTFVRRGQRWYVDGEPAARRGSKELWDFGPVVAVRGQRSLVLGHPGHSTELSEIAAETDRDVPRVTAFWGRAGWTGRVVVLVPSTYAELRAVIGGGDLTQFAALATAEVDGTPGSGSGDRIVVNPDRWSTLSTIGRQVVFTHEITHVATRPVTGDHSPDWLVEGIADYAAFRSTTLPPAVAAPHTAAEFATHPPVLRLPPDRAFDGTSHDLASAYERAWLACRYVADHWSERALIRLYRAVGTSSAADQTAAVRDGLRRVLRTTPAGFVAGWRRYVRSVLR